MIKALDLQSDYLSLKAEIDTAVGRVLASGRYVGGPEVEGLENEFARFCGTEHAVAVGNGTDALRFTLIAAGVGELEGKDEVITSPLTFIATTEAIHQAGGKPVFVDIEPDSFTLDASLLEGAMTPRTVAIVPVHLYGQVADMGPILEVARRRGVKVVEDACQAHGALYGEKRAGSLGDAGCFSFYPTKNLGAFGEGGMVVTSLSDIAGRVRRLRDHGQSEKYVHSEEGYNGRLDALQAAILRVKLRHLEARNERRRAVAARYREGLRRAALRLPREMSWGRHVYHQFTVRLGDRDRVRQALLAKGIETGLHYAIPLHLQPCYARMGLGEGSFPQAERAAREVLSLPLHPGLSEEQVDSVCEAVRSIVGEA